jgi:hypothetical protein
MNLSYKETSIKEQIESIYTTFKEEAKQKNIELQIHNALSEADNLIRTDKEKSCYIVAFTYQCIKIHRSRTIEIGCFKRIILTL